MNKSISHIQLDKQTPVPLYYQLKKQLLHLVESGELKEGDMLPAEKDLCEQLSISRPTVRQALNELVDEGYLSRFKGKGTFVSKPKVKDRFLSKLQSFNSEMRNKGMVPKTEVISVAKMPGNPEINERLELSYDDALLYLSRIRYADDIPLVYVETYLPYKGFEPLLEGDYTKDSLYDLLEQLLGIRITYARREIEAVAGRKKEAAYLDVPANTPICLVRSVAYAEGRDLPVEYSVARYRGDRTRFSVDTYRYGQTPSDASK